MSLGELQSEVINVEHKYHKYIYVQPLLNTQLHPEMLQNVPDVG